MPRAAPPGEQELLARLRAGDDAAFAALVDRHHQGFVRLARAFVTTDASADEVVQESWTAIIEGLAAFEGRSSLYTWMYRIVTNLARSRATREGRTVPFSAEIEEPGAETRFTDTGAWNAPPRPLDEATPERLAGDRQLVAILQRGLDMLPPAQRAVVSLRDIEGLEAEEVCNILSIGETNQRVLLHRGRMKLRRLLEEHLRGAKGP